MTTVYNGAGVIQQRNVGSPHPPDQPLTRSSTPSLEIGRAACGHEAALMRLMLEADTEPEKKIVTMVVVVEAMVLCYCLW